MEGPREGRAALSSAQDGRGGKPRLNETIVLLYSAISSFETSDGLPES